MVKAPHCVELAWKFPSSTCKYLVLTVCDRNRLKSATFVPDAIHTTNTTTNNTSFHVPPPDGARVTPSQQQLTVCILERLFLLGRFRDDFDALRSELTNLLFVSVKHLDAQHEVLALVRVRDEQGLRRAVALNQTKTTNQYNKICFRHEKTGIKL